MGNRGLLLGASNLALESGSPEPWTPQGPTNRKTSEFSCGGCSTNEFPKIFVLAYDQVQGTLNLNPEP